MSVLTKADSPAFIGKGTQLARTQGDVTLQELNDISLMMRQSMASENQAVRQAVMERINKDPGLFGRLFPNAFEKEDRRITLERMRSTYEQEKRFLEIYTAVQLQIARKEGDALIASVGMELQGKLAAFATRKIDELSETIGDSRQRFLARIKPQLEDLERYTDFPDLHDAARLSIRSEIKTYFAGIDELLGGFINALKSKVSG